MELAFSHRQFNFDKYKQVPDWSQRMGNADGRLAEQPNNQFTRVSNSALSSGTWLS